jgi:hypothetical protein
MGRYDARDLRETLMTPRLPRTLLLMAVALSACGSSSPATSPGEQTRTAQQIYGDFLDQMTRETSVHVVGHQVDTTGATSDIDVLDGQSSARITLVTQGATLYLVVTAAQVYAAQSIEGPWITAPADLAVNARSLTLANTVRCGRIEHGGLTRGAVSTIDGQKVIAIDDDGRAPGASPSTVYVAVTGAPRLVRVVDHGAGTPGGRTDCGHAAAAASGPPTLSAKFDFSDWGKPLTVTPPPSGGV